MINFYKLLEEPRIYLLTQKIFSRGFSEVEEIIYKNCHGWTLDLGAGPGRCSHLFQERFIITDINLSYLKFAKKTGNSAICVCMNAEQISFKSTVMDSIISVGLFHHVNNCSSRKIFEEMLRVIKPVGKIIIIDVFSPTEEKFFLKSLINNLMCKLDRGKYIKTSDCFESIVDLDRFKYEKIKIRGAFLHHVLAYIIYPKPVAMKLPH